MSKNRKIAMTTPKKLLGIVCKYYGLRDVNQLAASDRLSSWRYSIHEESRTAACLVLQTHCEIEPEDLQSALKQMGLDWSSVFIRMNAEMARRKIAENHMFRISVENIEQMILAALIGKPYKVLSCAHLGWKRAGYINQGKAKKGKTI